MKIWAVSLLALIMLLAGVVYYLRNIYFYRDPLRISPGEDRFLYSPCDGLVVYVKKITDGEVYSEKLGKKIAISEITRLKDDGTLNIQEGWLIGIYMSPLDVHFNYAPQSGRVKAIVYTPAKVNYPMVDLWEYLKMTYFKRAVENFADRFHLQNERNTIVLEVKEQDVVLVEIADKFVNKIDCYVKVGDKVKAGDKISFIRRGSQVDMLVPSSAFEPLVKKGDRVTGAITPVFQFIN
jgi:phosphatidylserine decarboxylase